MDLKGVLEYCPNSPSGLVWKVDIWSGEDYRVLRVSKGDIAGSNKNSKGYWRVIYKKKSYFTHRVIWEMFYGKIPKKYVYRSYR